MLKIVWLILGFSAISFGSLLCQEHESPENGDRLVGSELSWSLLDAAPPRLRLESALVHDPMQDVFVAFGGRDENWDAVDETWQFDPEVARWSRVETKGSPGPRFMHEMVFDSKRRRMILFGGTDGTTSLDELWTFDPVESTWSQIPRRFVRRDDGGWPSPRQLHAMAYDTERDRLLVFGGRRETGGSVRQFGDTWEFDFEAGIWIERTPDISPEARDHADMVFDPQRRLAVLFGGSGASGPLGDTWVFDPSMSRWTEMEPLEAPSPRDHHVMAYDSNTGSILLVGGSFEDDRIFRYLHDEGRWRAVEPTGRLPTMADHMLGALGDGQFVLMGGFRGGPGPQGATWVLNARSP